MKKVELVKLIKEVIKEQDFNQQDYSKMTLSQIANVIKKNWLNVNYAAQPYLDALFDLEKITDNYYLDSGSSIVAYFLSNATSWKGEIAKVIKTELKKQLDSYYNKKLK